MITNMVDISIVIPVYNAETLIDRCLDSVFTQSVDYNLEVILVDDGSTDNSVKKINNRKEQEFIRLFKQPNSGPAKARNKGIQEAQGKYLAFLDADDYWLPGFLEVTFKFLEAHAECVAVSVAQKHLTTSGVNEAPCGWERITDREQLVLKDFYSFWAEHDHVCTGSIMIRTKIAKDTGGQRTDLRICEDLEYWAFIATYGKIGYIPKLLFVSDGSKVTETVGWVQKHLPRWNAAVTIEEWQKRILRKRPQLAEHLGFKKARGRIAKNLAYSILLSKRYELAKEQIERYGKTFPNDKVTKMLRLAVWNSIFWHVISRLLVFREYHRK